MNHHPIGNRLHQPPQKLLFVCSRNQWRSPTAEAVFRRQPGVLVRSAGTSPNARRTVRLEDVLWADCILVMEHKHKQRLRAMFPRALQHKAIQVLDIADDYRYMDPELVSLLRQAVAPYLPVIPPHPSEV